MNRRPAPSHVKGDCPDCRVNENGTVPFGAGTDLRSTRLRPVPILASESMRRRRRPGGSAALAVVVLLSALLAPSSSPASDESPQIAGVRVGFGGRYKVGLWTPVQVTVRGGSQPVSARVSLIVPDGDGVPSRVSAITEIAPGVEKSIALAARFGRVNGNLTVKLEVAGQVIARQRMDTGAETDAAHFLPAVPTDRRLIVTVGAAPVGVEDALRVLGRDPAQHGVVARLEHLQRLPVQWYGYEGVDAVILSTSQAGLSTDLASGDPRVAALDQWVRMGGMLVLCAGARADKVLGPGMPLAGLAPGKFEGVVTVRQTEGLEAYAGASEPVRRVGGAEELRAAHLSGVDGVVEARDGGLPVVVRAARGFGQIVFLATDLDQPPLDRWNDRGLLVARLLGWASAEGDDGEGRVKIMHYGFTDIAGQLRSALDQFAGVRLVPFWLLAALLVAYILLIGPVDYFVLRHMGRMGWTWISFSGIVILVSLGAYGLAYWLKGDRLRLNQADVLDVDLASGMERGTSWANIFSPRMDYYNLAVQPAVPGGGGSQGSEALVAWLGLPGSALGGMDSRASSPVMWDKPYDFAPKLDAIERLPIPVWSSRSFTARWSAAADPGIKADLVREGSALAGTVVNTLDISLPDCILAYDRWAYDLGSIEPRQAVRVGPMTSRSELKTLLTGRRIVFEDREHKFHQESAPYDQASVDLPDILRMMTFFEAIDGRRYTGLDNGYQRWGDLSGLLKTNRAVLLAQRPVSRPAAQWLRDGEPLGGPKDTRVVFYRFIAPVRMDKQ